MQKHSCYLAQKIHRSVQFTFSILQVGVPALNFMHIKVSLANRTTLYWVNVVRQFGLTPVMSASQAF